MMDHNKIISTVAKTTLSPLGLRRQGRSRVWYDDRGWWAIVVEFQPSSWSRGSYLNVGVSWMLYEHAHWTFDVGYRENDFKPAKGEEQFEAAMAAVARHATDAVEGYRSRFATLDEMYSYYRNLTERSGWPDYYAGILAALAGDIASAELHFRQVLEEPCRTAWMHGRRLRCVDLLRLLPDREAFRDSVMGIVMRCRAARLVEEIPIQEIGLP